MRVAGLCNALVFPFISACLFLLSADQVMLKLILDLRNKLDDAVN